jgi:hypothetical protein
MDIRGGKVEEAVHDVVGDLWDWSRSLLGCRRESNELQKP